MNNLSRRIRKKGKLKEKSTSFLQRNIRLGILDMKNLHDSLIDNEIVECHSCIEEEEGLSKSCLETSNKRTTVDTISNLENGLSPDKKICQKAAPLSKSRIEPRWEYLNMSFQKAEVMEEIYKRIRQQGDFSKEKISDVAIKTPEDQAMWSGLAKNRQRSVRIEMFDELIQGIGKILKKVKGEKASLEEQSDLVSGVTRIEPEQKKMASGSTETEPEAERQLISKGINGVKQIPTEATVKKRLELAFQQENEFLADPKLSKQNVKNICKNIFAKTNLKTPPFQAKTESQRILKSYSFINCDVNYFNFEYLSAQTKGFDVILMDPPWRIKGGQKNDSQFMFANNRFCLEYDTMSNEQIASLNIGSLSEKGFMFLWILGNQIKMACEMLAKWGYDLVDLIVWVKTKNGRVYLSHGYYLMHSFEVCLVGYKCPSRKRMEYFSKVSNNIIFSEVRSKSQKPNELYEIIELMMPGAKRLEIFARNNNLRQGWFSIGNQLGEEFCKWKNHVSCDGCSNTIAIGTPRFKSKLRANFDLCQRCYVRVVSGANIRETRKGLESKNGVEAGVIQPLGSISKDLGSDTSTPKKNGLGHATSTDLTCSNSDKTFKKKMCLEDQIQVTNGNHLETSPEHFFRIENKVNEAVLHKYYSCDGCKMSPIWGLRFSCNQCPDIDLCEGCYDLCQETGPKSSALYKNLKGHSPRHDCNIHELQELSYGYQTHLGERCASCYQKPIIGVCFRCKKCAGLSLCQKCYFQDESLEVPHRKSHLTEHSWDMIIHPHKKESKNKDCSWCEKTDNRAQYECDICHEFYLCGVCHIKRDFFVTNKASTHKVYHTFSKITEGLVCVPKK